MDLTRVITGQVVTEKAEQLKGSAKTYTLQVAPSATKLEVKQALKRFYGVEAESVRMINTVPKSRRFGNNQQMEKRHCGRKALVTLTANSKALDLTVFSS